MRSIESITTLRNDFSYDLMRARAHIHKIPKNHTRKLSAARSLARRLDIHVRELNTELAIAIHRSNPYAQ